MVETESTQHGVPHERRGRPRFEPLPHVVFQPVVVARPSQRLTDAFVRTIRGGRAVLAVCSGATADANVGREYLLHPEKRAAIAQRVSVVSGLEVLRDVLADDQLCVLHYKYDRDALLAPCLVRRGGSGAPTTDDECALLDDDEVDCARSTRSSDIQIVLLIRYGGCRSVCVCVCECV